MYKHSKMKYNVPELWDNYNQKISYLYRYFTLMVASNIGFLPRRQGDFQKCQ